MRIVVLYIHIMRIIAGNDLYLVLSRQFDEHFVYFILFRHTVPLQLYIIVFLENIQPPFEFILAFFFSFLQNGLRYHGAKATGGSNKTFVITKDEFFINAGIFAVHPFNKTERCQLDEIAVAFFIFCQQYLVMAGISLFLGKCFLVAVRRNIE